VDLFVAGAFTIRASCFEDFNTSATDVAQVDAIGPSESSFAGPRTGGDTTQPSFTSGAVARAANSAVDVEGGHVTAVAPNGHVVSVSASARVNHPVPQGDCVFGATAIGP
jgi:hypothetical protein